MYLSLPKGASLSELDRLFGQDLGQAYEDLPLSETKYGTIGGIQIRLNRQPKRLHFYFDAFPSNWGITIVLFCNDHWNLMRMGLAFDIFRHMFLEDKGDYLCWHIEGPVIFCSHNEKLWVNSEILEVLGSPPNWCNSEHRVVYTPLPSVAESGNKYMSSLFDPR